MEKFIIRSRAEKQDQCRYMIAFRKDTLYCEYNGLFIGVYLVEDGLLKMHPNVTKVHIKDDKLYWEHKNVWYWLPSGKIEYKPTSQVADDLFYRMRIFEHSMCRVGDGTWLLNDYSNLKKEINDFNDELKDIQCVEGITIVEELEERVATEDN